MDQDWGYPFLKFSAQDEFSLGNFDKNADKGQ